MQPISSSEDENDSNSSLSIVSATICWSHSKPLRSTAGNGFSMTLSCWLGTVFFEAVISQLHLFLSLLKLPHSSVL